MKQSFSSKFIISRLIESQNLFVYSLLLAILILGSFFRFYGLNWDQGYHLHPDERMITMVTVGVHLPQNNQEWQNLLTPQSPLNPKFFAYGSLPIYLLKSFGFAFSYFNPRWASYDWINLLGRGISATADLGIVLLLFFLGSNIWTRKVGLLAAGFYALAVFPVQAAHFYAVDSLLNFFVLLTLYLLVLFYQKSSFRHAFLVGTFFGLSLATKVSATVLISAIGTTLVVDLFLIFLKRIRQIRFVPKIHKEIFDFAVWLFSCLKTPRRQKLLKIFFFVLKYGLIIGLVSLITFLLAEPYALIDFSTFWRQTQEQQAMTKNAYTFPYTLQYVGTTPYLYGLKNLVLWGMGIPLGILGLVGTLWLLIRLIIEIPKPGEENREAKTLILMIFLLAYFAIVGRFAIKFMRYFLPLYPLLTLFAAWFILTLIESRKKFIGLIGKITLGLVLGTTFFWVLAFISIYSKPPTRLVATEWINQTIPPGSKLATEHWDDRVPMWGDYQYLEMPMYEYDQAEWKWQKVELNLKEADYIILASNRLYVPLQKLADCQKFKVCYPKTAKYYQDLFNGKLGFTKVAEFSNYPQLSIINYQLSIIDDSADESFTVYDHPKIIIFKKS